MRWPALRSGDPRDRPDHLAGLRARAVRDGVERMEPERLFSCAGTRTTWTSASTIRPSRQRSCCSSSRDVADGTRLTVVERASTASRCPAGRPRSRQRRRLGRADGRHRAIPVVRLRPRRRQLRSSRRWVTRPVWISSPACAPRGPVHRRLTAAGVTRQAVTKHLHVLAAAGIVAHSRGRERIWGSSRGPADRPQPGPISPSGTRPWPGCSSSWSGWTRTTDDRRPHLLGGARRRWVAGHALTLRQVAYARRL